MVVRPRVALISEPRLVFRDVRLSDRLRGPDRGRPAAESQIEFAQDIKITVRFRNLLQARGQGLEVATCGRWWRQRVGLQASATLLEAKDLVSGQPLTYRPRIIAHLLPSLHVGAWELQADYRYASRIEAVKLFQYDERVPQKVWNLPLIWHVGNLQLHAAVNKVLDYYYTQIERTMGEIRNFAVWGELSFDRRFMEDDDG